jgi:hypothetical protein
MQKLYEAILKGLQESGGFYNARRQGHFESYLASLQSFVKRLRQAYRNNKVAVDYSSTEMQAAYLIAYYPHYVEMTLKILKLLSSYLKFNQEIKACFFGADPCPEVAGLTQFLAEQFPKTERLVANVYDIASNTWTPSRNITHQYVIPQLWQGQVELNSYSLNLCARQSFQGIRSSLEGADLYIFQNCLNELGDTLPAQENVNFLFDTSSQGSIMIIADLQYGQNHTFVQVVREMINRKNDFKILADERSLAIRCSLPPLVVRRNLLTDPLGPSFLSPRVNVNFLLLAACKNKQAYNYSDDVPF